MIFAKYEFTPDKWNELKPLIYIDDTYQNCAVHEIGHINESPMYAVDIMWFGEIPDEFSIYEVFPNPVGVHTFAGCEDMYLNRFCEFNTNTPYCEIN